MIPSSLLKNFCLLSVRNVSSTPVLGASVFTKKQKKIDPEVAKAREARRRKKLTREIRQMQKHSKKPKPVTELTIDVKAARNLSDRVRAVVPLTEEVEDQRAVVLKAYNSSRNELMRRDLRWIRSATRDQDYAMSFLKTHYRGLYEAAVKVPEDVTFHTQSGPVITPPLTDYRSPDGDYEDTTRTWE